VELLSVNTYFDIDIPNNEIWIRFHLYSLPPSGFGDKENGVIRVEDDVIMSGKLLRRFGDCDTG